MANKSILEYLRESPNNTNVNVVKGMIRNGSGTIEKEIIFDDDINLIYNQGGSYSSGNGSYTIDFPIITTGVIKIIFENVSFLSTPGSGGYLSNGTDVSNLNLPFQSMSVYADTTNNQLIFTIYPYMETNEVDSSDLQAYCQEPHHLKIEWFII